MALLSLDQQSEAAGHVRGIEANADQALSIVRYLENCEDSDELRSAADRLRQAAKFLLDTACDLSYIVGEAEDADIEPCAECGDLCTAAQRDDCGGYCSDTCEDINN